jgi:catechol 2,3-dioxygenase-like lactoylglutathione lyase family enzyme
MADFRLTGLRSIELGVPDVRADVRFYTEVWGLALLAEREGVAYLRGTHTHHHILSLRSRPQVEALCITFTARSRVDLDALHAAVTAAGAGAVTAPARLAEPESGWGFAFKDPEGRFLRIVADETRHAGTAAVPDRPERLAHVVLNSSDVPRATKFFTDVLGFRISDRTRHMDFIRCNRDHHSVAFARGESATLHHIAFHMPDLDSVMRGAGRMKDRGWPIGWGVGRHGPGNNVFAYFVGPHDVPIEYTAEVQEVDDDYPVRGPEHWKWPPGRSDQWGVTEPPSERLHAAQRKVAFSREFALN